MNMYKKYLPLYQDGGDVVPVELQAVYDARDRRMFGPVGNFSEAVNVPAEYVPYDGVSRAVPQWVDPDPRAYLRRVDTIDYNSPIGYSQPVPVQDLVPRSYVPYNRESYTHVPANSEEVNITKSNSSTSVNDDSGNSIVRKSRYSNPSVLEKQKKINELKRQSGDTNLLVEDGIEGPKTRRAIAEYLSNSSSSTDTKYAPKSTISKTGVINSKGTLFIRHDGSRMTPYQFKERCKDDGVVKVLNSKDRADIETYNKWAIANGKKPIYVRYQKEESDDYKVYSNNVKKGVKYEVSGGYYKDGKIIKAAYGTKNTPKRTPARPTNHIRGKGFVGRLNDLAGGLADIVTLGHYGYTGDYHR